MQCFTSLAAANLSRRRYRRQQQQQLLPTNAKALKCNYKLNLENLQKNASFLREYNVSKWMGSIKRVAGVGVRSTKGAKAPRCTA